MFGQTFVQPEKGRRRFDHVELTHQLIEVVPDQFASLLGGLGVGLEPLILGTLLRLKRLRLSFELLEIAHE
jgi:hypothetical protein